MTLSLIVACGPEGQIGYQGRLPWPTLRQDMRWFRKQTLGKAVLMGRRTWESLPAENRPLPERFNIVLSTTMPRANCGPGQPHYVARTVADALRAATPSGEAVVIGGAQLYHLFFDQADTIYLTKVARPGKPFPLADAFFPYPPSLVDWEVKAEHDRFFGEPDGYRVGFFRFTRRLAPAGAV